jgi:hypothetical protein
MLSISSNVGRNSYIIASNHVKSVIERSMTKLTVKRWDGQWWSIHQRSTKAYDKDTEFLVRETDDYDVFI